MNWLKGNGYSALVSKRCYSGNKIRCSGCCWLTSVNKKQEVNRLIRGFLLLRFIDRDVTVRRVRSHWSLWSVSFLWPRVSSSLINPQSQSDVSKPIRVGGKTHTILCPTTDWTPPPVHYGWDNLFLQLQINMAQQFPAATTVHHNRGKTSKPSDSNCSLSRGWHPREHQRPRHPKTPNIISCLWASLATSV